MGQNSESGKDVVPIMIRFVGDRTHSDQRQRASYSVAHVGGYASETMKKREYAECRSGNLSLPNEVRSEQRRNHQLEDRPAPMMQCLPKITEEKMTVFMNRQVHIVKQRKLTEMSGQIEEKPCVERQPREKLTTRDVLPFNFGKLHCSILGPHLLIASTPAYR